MWSPLVTDQGQLPGFRGGCHRLGCRLGCGGAVPGGEPLVPGDLTASCLTPLFSPCPGHAGLSSGPTWDVQVGVPFLQGSPLLQALRDPRSCPASCTRSWWGHLWPHCCLVLASCVLLAACDHRWHWVLALEVLRGGGCGFCTSPTWMSESPSWERQPAAGESSLWA